MLDVHPPHSPTHTWRDFFIHVGTICVGLLIAIGLEQTVEAIHHHHQRHQLEHDLAVEAENNLELMRLDEQYFLKADKVLAEARSSIANAQATTAVDVSAIVRDTHVYYPDQPVWNTAREGALINLLPRPEAAKFDLVYTQQGIMTEHWHAYTNSMFALEDFSLRFRPTADAPLDLSRMSTEDRREYIVLLANVQGQIDRFRMFTRYAHDVTEAAIHSGDDDRDAFQKIGITKRH
jgi:hypothetical protein